METATRRSSRPSASPESSDFVASATATRTIDVTGKVVVPGFIDLHSHGDGGLATMALRHTPNVVAQGITLVVVNQDGRSPRWPLRDQKALYDKQGIGPNAALMVGHGTLRSKVMGQRDDQIATDADIDPPATRSGDRPLRSTERQAIGISIEPYTAIITPRE